MTKVTDQLLEKMSIAELMEQHRQVHASYMRSGLSSATDADKDITRHQHTALMCEFINREVYHPIVSPLDMDSAYDLELSITRKYFDVLSDIAHKNNVLVINSQFPHFFDTSEVIGSILIEKYSRNQPRDDFGRWVEYGQAGLGGGSADQDPDDRAKVRVWNADEKRIETVQNNMFGRQLTAQNLSNLMGNPVGGTIELKVVDGKFRLKNNHDSLVREHVGTFSGTKGNLTFRQTLTPRINLPDNTTAKLVNTQVPALRQVGTRRFLQDATRDYDRDHNYRNAARAGFDAPLSPNLRKLMQESTFEDIKGATKISDLMKLENGRSWWKTHGQGFLGEFDLNPGSTSTKLLKDFLNSEEY